MKVAVIAHNDTTAVKMFLECVKTDIMSSPAGNIQFIHHNPLFSNDLLFSQFERIADTADVVAVFSYGKRSVGSRFNGLFDSFDLVFEVGSHDKSLDMSIKCLHPAHMDSDLQGIWSAFLEKKAQS